MNRQALGRVLLLLGLAAALGVVWATWQPQRFADLTGGIAPPVTLGLLALLFGLAGAVLGRRAIEPPRRAEPPAAPRAPGAEVDPEDSVETIRRRLRETEEKE
jgi:hypothetical protein